MILHEQNWGIFIAHKNTGKTETVLFCSSITENRLQHFFRHRRAPTVHIFNIINLIGIFVLPTSLPAMIVYDDTTLLLLKNKKH
jgi:hypothetical protein